MIFLDTISRHLRSSVQEGNCHHSGGPGGVHWRGISAPVSHQLVDLGQLIYGRSAPVGGPTGSPGLVYSTSPLPPFYHLISFCSWLWLLAAQATSSSAMLLLLEVPPLCSILLLVPAFYCPRSPSLWTLFLT